MHQVWHLTCTTAAVVAAVRVPLCNGKSIAGLLSRGSSFYHDLPRDDLLVGGGLVFGDAVALDDAPPLHGDDPALGHLPVPHGDVSEVLVCTCRRAKAAFSGSSRVVCCWSWKHWVECS